MKAKLLGIFLTFLIFTLSAQYIYALPEIGAKEPSGRQTANILSDRLINAPDIKTFSAILTDAKKGQILFEKDSAQKLHIPAANKIMTALIAIEKNPDLSVKVTISKESVEAEGSTLNLVVGEKYALEDLLHAIMLTSANDAARAIAEFTGSDTRNFVALMNNKSHELNMKDTHFTNATGLFDENQYTTAYDTALLIKYALNNPTFNRMFSYQAKPWISENGQTRILTNQNELFWSYDGIDGGKVGYNKKEQQSAITTATRGNLRLICIVLDAPEKSVFEDSAKLLDFGFANFRSGILVPKGYIQKSVPVGDREVNLVSKNDVYYTHPVGENYIKSLEFSIMPNLEPPITKDQIVGIAKYVLSDNTVIEVDLYSDIEIPLPEDFYSSLMKKVKQNRDIFILVGILLVIEAILVLYNIIRLIGRLLRKISSQSGAEQAKSQK